MEAIRKLHNRKAFTIVELVIVIAVIAILATVLVPTFGDVISKAQDTAAKQEAKNAYTHYLIEQNGSAPEVMVYKHANGKVVALENGVPVNVYETEEEFFATYQIAAFPMTAGTLYTTTGEAGSNGGNSDNTSSAPDVSWDTDGDGTLSILAIGNSFSVDALEYVYQIAQNIGIEDIVIGNLYKGGCDLATHTQYAKNETPYTGNDCYYNVNDDGTWVKTASTSKAALQSRSWDFVMLQQVSGQSGQVNTYNENLDYMITYAKEHAPSAKLVWHMTWAYEQDSTHSAFTNYGKNQTTMYNAIVSAVQNKIVTNSNFDLIVPSGTAVQNSRTSVLGDTTTRDGYHMSHNYGRYLTGLMVVKTLTGLSVDEATYRPAGVDELEQRIAIDAVNKAAAAPFEKTESTYCTDEYILLNIDWFLHGFWNSSDSKGKHTVLIDKNNNTDSNHPNFFTTPYRLTKAGLPIGSVILLEDGWQYRPDGWTAGDQVNTARPGNVTDRSVVVTEDWWDDYTLRAFNVSKVAGGAVTQAEMDAEKLKIYVPKSMYDNATQLVTGFDAVKNPSTGTATDCHSQYMPFAYSNLTTFKNTTISKITLYVTGKVQQLGGQSGTLDPNTVYYYNIYVIDADAVKADGTYSAYTSGRKYTLSVKGDAINGAGWYTFDVSHLGITVGEGETLGFGDSNTTLGTAYLQSNSTLTYWGRHNSDGSKISYRGTHSLLVGVEGVKIPSERDQRMEQLRNLLQGKYLSVFGASMCTYEGYSNNANANSTIGNNAIWYYTEKSGSSYAPIAANDTFWMQLINELDMELLVNNSSSGSKVLDKVGEIAPAYIDRCVQLHADTGVNIGKKPDVIVSFMGNNDFTSGKTAGTADNALFAWVEGYINGTHKETPDTFAEGYAVMVSKMAKEYPNAEIFLFNMAHRTSGNPSGLLLAYNEIIHAIAGHYGCHVVDLTYSVMSGTNYSPYSFDNLHPNAAGMDIWTDLIIDAMIECYLP